MTTDPHRQKIVERMDKLTELQKWEFLRRAGIWDDQGQMSPVVVASRSISASLTTLAGALREVEEEHRITQPNEPEGS